MQRTHETADGHVQYGGGTANTGGGSGNFTAANFHMKDNGNGTTTRKGYVRFDLSTLTSTVTEASLTMEIHLNDDTSTPTDASKTITVWGLNDGATAGGGFLGEDWDPASMTYGNAPANVTSGAGHGGMVNLGAGTTNGGQAVELGTFTVTVSGNVPGSSVVVLSGSPLIDFLNADTDNRATFILARTGGNLTQNFLFNTEESTGGRTFPTLTVDVIPEPSSTVWLGLGGFALIVRRRR